MMHKFRSIVRNIVANPFKYYCMGAGFTFSLVGITNTATAFADEIRREIITTYPQIFFTGVLAKSTYFGLIFPAFYAQVIIGPRQAFFLGGSIEKGIQKISNEL